MLLSLHTFKFYQSLVARHILENKNLSLTVTGNKDLLDGLKKRRLEFAKRHDDLTARIDDVRKRSDELLKK